MMQVFRALFAVEEILSVVKAISCSWCTYVRVVELEKAFRRSLQATLEPRMVQQCRYVR